MAENIVFVSETMSSTLKRSFRWMKHFLHLGDHGFGIEKISSKAKNLSSVLETMASALRRSFRRLRSFSPSWKQFFPWSRPRAAQP
jgi:hypothetical protein